MAERSVYSAMGVAGYEVIASWRKDGVLHLRLEVPVSKCACAGCGGRDVIRRGYVERKVHGPPVGLDRVVMFLRVPRLHCRDCHRVLPVKLRNVVPLCNYTKSFARLVVDLRKMMTIRDVAHFMGVGEGMVRSIEKKFLDTKFGKPRLCDLKVIAIDEIHVGRGKFLTIVIDWQTGAIVFVGRGKGGDTLKPFWKRLKSSRAKVEAVATDMSSAYHAAAREHLPAARHVFDRFHIIKLMNDKLTELRREVFREAEAMDRPVLKGIRWLLLKLPEHLDDKKNERQRLDEALRLNTSLATAYYLKEDLRQIWTQTSKANAERFLADWCARARASGIGVLQTLAKTLQTHRHGILNWYDDPISTGPLEGINNKIGALQRMAYGYRNHDYFIAKLYALHLAKFQLIG